MSSTFTTDNPTEALILEHALTLAREITRTAETAPDGQVLRLAEVCTLNLGREFLRKSLEIALQAQAEAVEKKRPLTEPVHAASVATIKGNPLSNC